MKKQCVILIHGLGRGKGSMSKLSNALTKEGFDVISWSYDSMNNSITDIAILLTQVIMLNSKYHEKVHFVTHSMGGIVLRRALNKLFEFNNLGKIVMIAPPNNGSAAARIIINNPAFNFIFGPAGQELKNKNYLDEICTVPKCKFMVIAGTKSKDIKNPTSWITGNILEKPNDGTVSVEETKLPGMDSFFQVDDSHTVIMNNKDVIEETIKYLTTN
jgi:pimeloyl-ACP methyl ester carboxylesterase